MTPRWDAYFQSTARQFLDSLTPTERAHCRLTVRATICDRPDMRGTPNQRGEREVIASGWHFRYNIVNANTIEITQAYYSFDNPRHPLNHGTAGPD